MCQKLNGFNEGVQHEAYEKLAKIEKAVTQVSKGKPLKRGPKTKKLFSNGVQSKAFEKCATN